MPTPGVVYLSWRKILEKPKINFPFLPTEKSTPCSSASLLDDRNIQIDSKLKQYVLLNFSNKNYKDWDQVPHYVTSSEMDAARSRMRVHINLWIMFLGTAVCFAAALHFKRQNDSGALSWVESNIQEHDKWAKDFKKDH